ncbi:beta strand repeat-containing protein [Roseibium sp.]|uniref:beta strand repeat-containing protein n=1 Tax=Roseibium sp. TaxID=1936156 RepID=UPI003BAA7F80
MSLSFDATYYQTTRPDVYNAFIATAGSTGLTWAQFAQNHYNTFGRFEGSNPTASFNTNEYLNTYPDVAAAGVNPFDHFLEFGSLEGRVPFTGFPLADLDTAAYAAANPDLAAAGITTEAQLQQHFMLFGQFESRPATPTVVTPGSGETFNFTNAVGEALVGTSGDDTFNGVGVDGKTDTSTINAGDTADGGAGTDTLNIQAGGAGALAAGFSTTNIENIFITNPAGALTAVDATIFSGAEQLWFVDNGTAVEATGLTATQTLGLKGANGATVTGDFGSATTVNLALDGADGTVDLESTDTTDKGILNITGGSAVTGGVAQTVTVQDTGTENAGTVNVTATAALDVDISAADKATSVTVGGAGSADLNTLGAAVKTLDASSNQGGVTATGVAATQEVTGGSAGDTFTAGGDLADKGFINTGAGNDKVDMAGNNVDSGASIDLGDGDDSIVGTGTIDKAATVDGGAGTDTLALSFVGAANVGAFSNFEVFDVVGDTGTLDLDILASNNTVSEIVGSGALAGGVTLTNLGAGVGFRATADTGANDVTLTQKAAADLTVTLDADTTATTENDASTDVVASNATSLKAVFDTASVFTQTAANKNDQNIDLTGTKATTLEVVSGGTEATNQLDYTGGDDTTGGKGDLLTTVTVSGDQAFTFNYTAADATEITSIDASAHTGGLTTSLAGVKAGGTVTIGSGTDVMQVAVNDGATEATLKAVSGFEKAASTDAADVAAADLIDYANALTVGIEDVAGGDLDISKGVVTFLGAGPTTLDEAITQVDTAVTTANSAVVFEYVGNSYVFIENAGGDTVVKLTGTTGVTEVGVNGDANLYIV